MYILWLVELSRFSLEIDIVLGDQANQQPYLVILGQIAPILTCTPREPRQAVLVNQTLHGNHSQPSKTHLI
jgi:hypothetical protein